MPSDIAVRIANPEDNDAVQALLVASYTALFKGWYDDTTLASALPLITRANPVLLSSGRFYIAEADNIATGCGGWSFDRPGTGEVEAGLGHIRHFAVHPDWVRKGIGRTILDRSVRDTRHHRIARLECNSSLPAVEFYRALGFRDTGPVVADLGGGNELPGRLMLLDI